MLGIQVLESVSLHISYHVQLTYKAGSVPNPS
jgi:hypothetical protein